MPAIFIREDEAQITLKVVPWNSQTQNWDQSQAVTVSNLVKPYWATYEGGGLSANDSKTRSGGMGKEKSVGGPRTRADITMTIQNDAGMVAQHNWLEGCVGSAMVQVNVQYLDPSAGALTNGDFQRTGTLKSAELPKSDANGSAVGFYTVTISADE